LPGTFKSKSVKESFDLTGRVAVITGGAGLLGIMHAEAIAEMGGIPVIADVRAEAAKNRAEEIAERFGVAGLGLGVDITQSSSVEGALQRVLEHFGGVHILINNAANNPMVERTTGQEQEWSRLESFSLQAWNQDIAVGLTGAFLCSKIFGSYMAKHGGGVILNIASDLGVIAPDQRIYREEGVPDHSQRVKPISYSVVKAGLISMSRYLATYWSEKNIRVNSVSFGGVYNDQPDAFVVRLTNLIPMGRMANRDEYKGAIVFLCSDASSYMTGANLIIDGGRSCW
jgi:NAD(P)-dependent dehydrogenase (short-subunit alcohol dehydrogenase family)